MLVAFITFSPIGNGGPPGQARPTSSPNKLLAAPLSRSSQHSETRSMTILKRLYDREINFVVSSRIRAASGALGRKGE